MTGGFLDLVLRSTGGGTVVDSVYVDLVASMSFRTEVALFPIFEEEELEEEELIKRAVALVGMSKINFITV